jgi:hypothetical protein
MNRFLISQDFAEFFAELCALDAPVAPRTSFVSGVEIPRDEMFQAILCPWEAGLLLLARSLDGGSNRREDRSSIQAPACTCT